VTPCWQSEEVQPQCLAPDDLHDPTGSRCADRWAAGRGSTPPRCCINRLSLLVVEKQTFPRFVIGESLLPHSMDLLQEAGLLDCIQRQGSCKIRRGILRGGETATLIFPTNSRPAGNTPIKFRGADFDKALADAVAREACRFFTNHAVTAIEFDERRRARDIEKLDRPAKGSRAIRAGLQRTGASCLGFCAWKTDPLSSREALFYPCHGHRRPAGRDEERSGCAFIPEARGFGSFRFPTQNQRWSGGGAGIFPALSRESAAQLRGRADERPQRRRTAGRHAICLSHSVSAATPVLSNNFLPALCGWWERHGILDRFQFGRDAGAGSANRAAQALTRHLRASC